MQNNVDLIWVLIAASLVFLMQAGFAMLEAGFVRAKNSINIAVKNVLDFVVGSLAFWFLGYSLMFGATHGGLVGWSGLMLEGVDTPQGQAFFVFQLMFAGTATTIVSGAVSERMGFRGYALVSALVSLLVYPIFGHWAWGEGGWLALMGFKDFAGSSVVHIIGATVGLVGTTMLGPRHGRFTADGRVVDIPSFNLTLVTLGVFLLWFGWFGFNGGSTLRADGSVAIVIANTTLAAAAGGAAAFAIDLFRGGHIAPVKLLNGILGGLVAVTASADVLTHGNAVLVGALGGLFVCFGEWLLVRWRIDDPVGAVPVHGFGGIAGIILVPFFVDNQHLKTGDFVGQLIVQALGIVMAIAWAGAVSWLIFRTLQRLDMLRVSLEDEIKGLNVAEHGVHMTWIDTVNTVQRIVSEGDYSRRVIVEFGTEAGDVAASFNTLLDDLEEKISLLNRVSKGELSVVSPDPKSQKDTLTISIRHMIANLNTLMHNVEEKNRQLLELNRSLEARVEERTAELSEQKARLEALLETVSAAQRQLIESEKMAALGSLVAGVSHEINTPVGIAVTAASHLDEKTCDFRQLFVDNRMKRSDLEQYLNTTEETSRMLLTNLHRAADLVHSFKRVAVDQSTNEVSQINVREYIEETLLSLRPQFKGRPINVSIDCPEDIVIKVPAGPFSQVITNLVMNSLVHAFEPEGSGEIRIVIDGDRKHLTMSFRDNGKGIPPELLNRIFEPFFTTKRGQGGTGLGLHILYNIVTQQLSGKIQVSSEPGQGTEFHIDMPR